MNPYKQCPNCGRQFPVTDIFCDNCGCQLDLIAPEQAQPPQQPFVLPTQPLMQKSRKKQVHSLGCWLPFFLFWQQ